jgi:hypothetical protein
MSQHSSWSQERWAGFSLDQQILMIGYQTVARQCAATEEVVRSPC